MKRPIPKRERGMALLAVLILVAITGAIAAASMEKLRLSRLTAMNAQALDQARQDAIAAERLAVLIVSDLIARDRSKTTLAGGWNGATRRIPMPGGGLIEARLRDGGNCFNINSVVEGNPAAGFRRNPTGVTQFLRLMVLAGVPEAEAERVAEAATDWADTDVEEGLGGAEDGAYAGGDQPHRTGNTLFADVSELRALAGLRPESYERIRPFVCALPEARLSPINVNTLLPEQAVLIAMLAPADLNVSAVQRVLAQRPMGGWENSTEFWRNDILTNLAIPPPAREQVQVRTDWFALDVRTVREDREFFETALIDARLQPARLVQRRWERDVNVQDLAEGTR